MLCRRRFIALTPLAAAFGCIICRSRPNQRLGEALQQPESFTSLFDGKTFDGWEGDIGGTFRIEEGAIVGGSVKREIPRNEFLCTRREFGDFELRLKFKLAGDQTNAGVQFRTRRIPNHHEVIGYQADLQPR